MRNEIRERGEKNVETKEINKPTERKKKKKKPYELVLLSNSEV
jgi:hypothetical protein